MSYGSSSYRKALGNIGFVPAAAMMVFTFTVLVMTGYVGRAVELMETYQFLPLALSFVALATIFASSSTRDPRFYHPVELALTVVYSTILILHAFLSEIQEIVMQFNPWASIVIILLSVIVAGVVGR